MSIAISRRGGVRSGAGRKPKGVAPRSATISIRLTAESKAILQSAASHRNISVASLIEDYVRELADRGFSSSPSEGF